MASVSNGVKSWLLEKYAKQLEIKSREGEANSTAESLNSTKGGKEWKQISSLEGDGALQLTLIEDKHMILSSGSQIRESFALVNTTQWLKTYCKGDSVLFVIRMQNNEFRRFRVKFAHTGTQTGMDHCRNFIRVASPIIPINVIPLHENTETSQSQFVEDSQVYGTSLSQASQPIRDVSFERECGKLNEGSSLPDIARQVISKDRGSECTSTNLPTTDLSTLVRLCLSDPGFPDFVDKVEKELRLLTAEK